MKLKIALFVGAVFCLLPVASPARMFVPTGVDVGRIVAINANHAITLNNRTTYVPARAGIALNGFQNGDTVSVSYRLGEANSKVYFRVRKAAENARPRPLSQPPVAARKNFK